MAITYKVEIAFASAPEDATQTWTDVSQWVDVSAGMSIVRGRTDQVSQVQTSKLTFTVNNSDGRFTPEYAAGAYYPNVQIGKRVRVTATNGAHVSVRFDGRMDTWPVQFSAVGKYAEATLGASCRLKKLAQENNLKNIVSIETLRDNPTAYFPLSDNLGTANIGASVANWSTRSGQPGIVAAEGDPTQGTLVFGQTVGGPYVDGTLTSAAWRESNSPPDGKIVVLNSTTPLSKTDGSFSLECWVWSNSSQPNADGTLMSIGQYSRSGWSIGIMLSYGNGIMAYSVSGEAGTYRFNDITPDVLNDSATHHVVMTYDSPTTTLKVYKDNILAYNNNVAPSFVVGSPPSSPMYCVRLGGVEYERVTPGLLVGTMSHAAVYDKVLSAADVDRHYTVGTTGFSGDLTSDRISRLLQYAGVATADIVIDEPGSTTCCAQDTSGKSVLELMNVVTDTERGVVFADRASAAIRIQGRNHRYAKATKFTLLAGQYEEEISPILDDSFLVNDMTVTRSDGASAEVTNAASIAANGTYSSGMDAIPQYGEDLRHLAGWRVNVDGVMRVRWPAVAVDLRTQTDSTLINNCLDLDIGDRFAVSQLPTQAPASTVTMFVEGYTETISLETHRIDFNASKGDIPVWILEDPTYGVIDSTNVIAY